MRISGLASGMDTEKMVTDLMNAHRIPLDKITQKKQYLEWQLDDYRTTNRQLFDFSKNTFDNMILSTSFSAKTVNISSPNDVAIRNMGSTSDFSGTIQVTQLAKNATFQSAELIVNSNKITDKQFMESTLSDLKFTGTKIIINTIDKDGKVPAQGVEITFDPAIDTMKSVIDKINSKTGVNAFYDPHTGKIAMTAKNSGFATGGATAISIGGDLAESLKINGSSNNGLNAEFSLNGLDGMERSSNTFQINGFEFSLKQVTTGTPITFNSAPDTDKIFDSVVKYVDEYNKLIEDLNKQIREPKYRDFQPLSAEQRKDMNEKDIELWDEKAKSGTLRRDPTISSMLTQMRTALMDTVDGQTLKSLGITTSNDYTANGKLVINETELKKAISDDPNKVHEMFSKDGTTVAEQGFARKLRTIVDKTQTSIAQRAGKTGAVNDTFSLGRSLKEMNSQIERFEARLKTMENRYWKQFTAMETAINRANSQSVSLMNAFSNN